MLILILLVCAFAWLSIRFRNHIPILMYHRLADVPGDRNALPPEKFAEQLKFLKQQGYYTASMEEVWAHYTSGKKLPKKSVLLTFDDGYADNFSAALPLLQKYQMRAAVFPISNWVGKENKWENFNKKPTMTMTYDQLQAWRDAGMEIGAHSVNHPFLSTCQPDIVLGEVSECKQALQNRLGCEISFFCYPYGNFSPSVITALKEAGYKGAFAIFDQVPLLSVDVFALPRIPIPARQSMWEFRLKVSRLHPVFLMLRQLERWYKRHFRKHKQ